MASLLIPLGIPALLSVILWLLLRKFEVEGPMKRIVVAALLPTVPLLLLAAIGRGKELSFEDLPVAIIVILCELAINGSLLFLLERRMVKASP